MTSTTCSSKPLQSFFFLYRWFLRRSLGLTLLLGLIGFLGLASGGLFTSTNLSYAAVAQCFQFIFGATLLFVLIFTCMNFSYLHKKRISDLVQAFPVGRIGTLLAAMASTFTSAILPLGFHLLLASLFCRVLPLESYPMGSRGQLGVEIMISHSSFFWQVFGIACLLLFACVVFSSLIAVCCGTALDTVISIVVINIAYPALLILGNNITTYMMPGYYADVSQNLPLITAGSPCLALLVPLSNFLSRTTFPLQRFLLWWAVVSFLLLGLTLLLHQRRKSEAAETAFAFRAPAAIIQVLVSFTAGLGLGYYLLFQQGTRLSNFLIGLFMGISVVFLVLEGIYRRGFKHLKKAIPYYLATLVLSGFFTLLLSTGLFGTFYQIPNVQDVAHVTMEYQNFHLTYPKTHYNISEKSVSLSGQTYFTAVPQYPTLSEPDNIQTVTELHAAVQTAIRETNNYDPRSSPYQILKLTYTMKNGFIVERLYDVQLKDLDYVETYSLDPLLSLADSEEFKREANGVFHTQENKTVYACGGIFNPPADYYGTPSFSFITKASYQNLSDYGNELSEALQQDILADSREKQQSWYKESRENFPFSFQSDCFILGFSKRYLPDRFTDSLPDIDTYLIPPYYEHTWKVLKEYGLYTDTEVTP